jgi:hypothetical protein
MSSLYFTLASFYEYIYSLDHSSFSLERYFGRLGLTSVSAVEAKREEFWGTRVEGRAEMWQTLKSTIEMYQRGEGGSEGELCSAILESSGLTRFGFDKRDCVFCFDSRGAKYDIPLYALLAPGADDKNTINIGQKATREAKLDENKTDSATPGANAAASGATASPAAAAAPTASNAAAPAAIDGATSAAAEKKDDGASRDGPLKLKVRLSNGAADLSLGMPADATAGDVKKRVARERTIAVERMILMYSGRRFADHLPLRDVGVRSGFVLQLMIRG